MSSLFTKIKQEITYDVTAAITNVAAEAKKLESYIAAKAASIEAHNKNILSIQNLIKEESLLKTEAETTLAKIKSIL